MFKMFRPSETKFTTSERVQFFCLLLYIHPQLSRALHLKAPSVGGVSRQDTSRERLPRKNQLVLPFLGLRCPWLGDNDLKWALLSTEAASDHH